MDTVMEPRELGPQFDFAPRTDGRKGRVDIKLHRRDLGVPKGALNMDGFFGVGIVGRHKTTQNVGSLWRSAFQLGASFIFTVGHKYKSFEATDTLVVHKRLPLIEHADWASFTQASPRGATWVAVTVAAVDGEEAEPAKVDALVAENAAAAAVLVTATTTITSDCSVSSAEPLATFQHPLRAVYVLGSDDSGLPLNVAVACHKHVVLPATRNGPFNVAMAGSVVLYDRLAKQQQQAEAKLGVKPRRKFNSSPK
jgi:tRNA(Leu) C34 or U34 (ribose-2'-O)-methylase TrmL